MSDELKWKDSAKTVSEFKNTHELRDEPSRAVGSGLKAAAGITSMIDVGMRESNVHEGSVDAA